MYYVEEWDVTVNVYKTDNKHLSARGWGLGGSGWWVVGGGDLVEWLDRCASIPMITSSYRIPAVAVNLLSVLICS
jgi:hypothetical protein